MQGEIKALLFADGVSVTAATAAPVGIPGSGALTGGGWFAPDTDAAPSAQVAGQFVYQFPDGADVKVIAVVRVPAGYVAGQQINMKLAYRTPSTSNTVKLKTTTYLIRSATDAVSSTTNSHASTNAAKSNGSPASRLNNETLDLTSATGTVNGVSVAAGDQLVVHLTRDYANDTDTDTVELLAANTEVTYQ
jgi:hypothetical protein